MTEKPKHTREEIVSYMERASAGGEATIPSYAAWCGSILYHLTHPELPAGEWIDWPADRGIPVAMKWRWDKHDDDPATSIDESWLPGKPCQISITPDPRVAELEANIQTLIDREKQALAWHDVSMSKVAELEAKVKELESDLVTVRGERNTLWVQGNLLRSEVANLKSELAADVADLIEPAKCWRLMTEYQRAAGKRTWRMEQPDGHLKVSTDPTVTYGWFAAPEAAVLAVCEPKPEPVLTLGTAELGRWVQPGISEKYLPRFISSDLGIVSWDREEGVFSVSSLSLDHPCHYINDPRKEVK